MKKKGGAPKPPKKEKKLLKKSGPQKKKTTMGRPPNVVLNSREKKGAKSVTPMSPFTKGEIRDKIKGNFERAKPISCVKKPKKGVGPNNQEEDGKNVFLGVKKLRKELHPPRKEEIKRKIKKGVNGK